MYKISLLFRSMGEHGILLLRFTDLYRRKDDDKSAWKEGSGAGGQRKRIQNTGGRTLTTGGA